MALAEHRNEVKDIDEKIVRLIDQRLRLASKIFEAKKAEGKEIRDPGQEKIVLDRAMSLAAELNLDAGAIRDIFQILIRMSLRRQQEIQGKDQR